MGGGDGDEENKHQLTYYLRWLLYHMRSSSLSPKNRLPNEYIKPVQHYSSRVALFPSNSLSLSLSLYIYFSFSIYIVYIVYGRYVLKWKYELFIDRKNNV